MQTVREKKSACFKSLTGECASSYVTDGQATQMWDLRSALMVLFHVSLPPERRLQA